MIDYITKKWSLSSFLKEMWNKDYILCHFDKDTTVSIWYKEVKRKYKKTETFKEFEEFIELYKNLKKWINGLSDPKLPWKYKELLNQWFLHKDIINNLKLYKEHLKSFSYKSPTMPQTYLNQHRFKEKWELDKYFSENKWKKDMLDGQKVPEDIQEPILTEAKVWLERYKDKELTTNIFQNMINKYFNPKHYK